MTGKERRQGERILFKSRILIITGDDNIVAEADSRDISLRGIYLLPEKKLPLDTFCALKISLTGESSTMMVTVHGKVCRHDEQGMGIAFLDLEEDGFIHIKNLIALHSADGALKKPAAFPCQEG
ncbi:MAG TPA: PilZ domain-containing protein [Desulfobulbaceae bacterium]|nr:PilZ domain-containing protein [Desulfobulbaceae bacterium]